MSLTCRTMARRGRIESVRVWRICGGALVGSRVLRSPFHLITWSEGKDHQALVRIHHPNPMLTLALRHAVHVFLGAMPVNVKGRTWAREQFEKRSGQRRASPSRRRWGVVGFDCASSSFFKVRVVCRLVGAGRSPNKWPQMVEYSSGQCIDPMSKSDRKPELLF